MYSSISNFRHYLRSKYKIPVLFLVLFLPLIVFHEHVIRKYRWSGGFMVLIDDIEIKNKNIKLMGPDLVVTGSSRGKESVRPSALKEILSVERPVNLATHSASSVDQIHNLAKDLMSSGKPIFNPEYLVVTVEPLHFSSKVVMFDKNRGSVAESRMDNNGLFAKAEGFIWSLQSENLAFQKKVNDFTSYQAIYWILLSSHPIHRRKLPDWFDFLVSSYYGTKTVGLRKGLVDSYNFIIVNRRRRWFTTVIASDNGYEGHKLRLTSPLSTRQKAFDEHSNVYINYVFPFFCADYCKDFSSSLKYLKEKQGKKIVLVRLPVFKSLYQLERQYIPNFDSLISEISETTGIPYINMNETNPEIGVDETYFTDGSHMEHDMTLEFSRILAQKLKEAFAGQ